MRRRYILAIAVQICGCFAFAIWTAMVVGMMFQVSLGLPGFIAFAAMVAVVGIATPFLKCERCGEDYFYRPGGEDSDRYWRWSFAWRANMYRPVKDTCQLCGLNRFLTTDRDPV